MTAFAWTNERVSALKMYREIGMSYAWIANEMGTTRNMAIGKFNRLRRGITGRPSKRKLARRPAQVRVYTIELENV